MNMANALLKHGPLASKVLKQTFISQCYNVTAYCVQHCLKGTNFVVLKQVFVLCDLLYREVLLVFYV